MKIVKRLYILQITAKHCLRVIFLDFQMISFFIKVWSNVRLFLLQVLAHSAGLFSINKQSCEEKGDLMQL